MHHYHPDSFLRPCSTLLRTDPFEAIAVVIVSSQKSAPVAVTLISYITGDNAAQGLLALPAIVGQLTQIFIGSAISALVAKYVSAIMHSVKPIIIIPMIVEIYR